MIRCRRIVIVTAVVIAVLAVLDWHAVDNSLSQEDRQVIPRYLAGVPSVALESERTFEDELGFIRKVQSAVLAVAPRNEGLPPGRAREPQDVFDAKRGLCHDRSRVIEKILRYAGFRARHVAIYSTEETGSALRSLVTKGVSSHAVTEVMTKRGWLIVDSNAPWVSMEATNAPVSIAELKSSLDAQVLLRWQRPAPSPIYEHAFTFVYGLYSRHGRFYPPYDAIPDVNYGELLQNVR